MEPPALLIFGLPEWEVILLLKPEASMLSTASTVIAFWTPDTVRRVQWPVITTVLETPLTLTMLSLQAIVRFSLMPETLSLPPGGGVGDIDGVDDPVRVVDGLGLLGVLRVLDGGPNVRETVGGELMIDRTPESWWAAKAAMPPARARNPTTMTVPRIHHVRLPEGGLGGGPESGPP